MLVVMYDNLLREFPTPVTRCKTGKFALLFVPNVYEIQPENGYTDALFSLPYMPYVSRHIVDLFWRVDSHEGWPLLGSQL